MPDGGSLTIETANSHLDDGYAATHADVTPGQYVMIAVTDTGTGMPPEVVAKAFEPFFTTKPVNKGTGLGLSQVFGFVKQSGGHVKIYSEPGEGTTVKVYLQAAFRRRAGTAAGRRRRPIRRSGRPRRCWSSRTIRACAPAASMRCGNSAIRSSTPATPRRRCASSTSMPNVALLFTDIVMPVMNGRKLAEEALVRRPDLKVLFTTGFTKNAVVHNGVLDPGVNFLAKPFTIDQLAAKIREVLDR